MNNQIKNYIEQNIQLLENDIVKFVMSMPGQIENQVELYFNLQDANVTLPDVVKYMTGILYVYDRYSIYSYNIQQQLENILKDNGAREDDSGEYGFLTGMSELQLNKTFQAFKNIVKSMITDDEYYINPELLRLFDL